MFNVTSVKEANDIIEALGDIADAVENNNIVPKPAAADDGKVLTANNDGTASWENASGGGIPTPTADDDGKVLRAYLMAGGTAEPEWSNIGEVPDGGTTGQVLTKTNDGYNWANASGGGGGGHMDVVKFDIAKAQFTQDGDMYKVYASTEDPDIATKIDHIISMSIVDDIDEGYPDLITPARGEFSIYYEDDLVTIKISSAIYGALGMRGNNYFYMTYYKA